MPPRSKRVLTKWTGPAVESNGLNPRWGGTPPGSEHEGGDAESAPKRKDHEYDAFLSRNHMANSKRAAEIYKKRGMMMREPKTRRSSRR